MPEHQDIGLANHTLVVPTYQRPALLKRLMSFLALNGQPMRVLVLDSSRDDNAAINRQTIEGLGGFARYRHFDSSIPMASKLAKGLADVETPTASFCADDDLVFPSAIFNALDMLDANPDHVSVHGLYFNFGEHGHDIQIMGEYAGYSIDASHPGARIFRLMQSYESVFYGVFRTAQIRQIFEGVAALPSLHYQELFQSTAAMILGKVARLPVFYAARRSGPAAEPDRDKWQTYYWFAEDPTEFMQHYRDYRDHLWSFYQTHSGSAALSRGEFDRICDMCHIMYFSKNCPPAYFHSVLQPFWPNDAFDEREGDLFADLGPGEDVPERSAGWLEALLSKMLQAVTHARRFEPTENAKTDLESLNAEVRALGGTSWNAKIVRDLSWLANNDDFRRRYLNLCEYLNAAPAD
ncbi:MAG: TIGR00180 family glycosyltransferase [Pseudomonadota bacterium]